MASVWIKSRLRRDGIRFVVGYRLGGRGAPQFHAAVLRSRAEAERLRDSIRLEIAAGRHSRQDLAPKKAAGAIVYFAALGDLIKIGIAADPESRCRHLNAELLHTEPGGRDRERELHEAFGNLRERGEWFRDDGRISRYMRKAAGC